ncbi:MAG: Ldh family oxidoreductase, partial [Eubacteriales bacterium]|nr:Ldh family oxidoreductase [Eubacteriales bacterium]
LVAAGAMDALEPDRARACAAIEPMMKLAQGAAEAESTGIVDMFGGVLSDALTSPEIPFVEDMQPEKTGFAVILLDIAHFIDVERFKEHAALYASLLKNSRTATGVKEIFMPGEIEARLIEQRKVSGNDYSDALEEELTDLARQSGAIGPAGTLRDLLT